MTDAVIISERDYKILLESERLLEGEKAEAFRQLTIEQNKVRESEERLEKCNIMVEEVGEELIKMRYTDFVKINQLNFLRTKNYQLLYEELRDVRQRRVP